MIFNWIKKGKIFDPSNRFDWMMNYAQVPTPIIINDRIRIYFTTRPLPDCNGNYISNISFIEVEGNNPDKVIYIHNKPVIELGKKGSFDEFGIMPGSIIKDNQSGLINMYYTGWTRLVSVPYSTHIGLAVSEDEGITFKRISDGPLIGLSLSDPYLINGPYLLKDNGEYHMWYASGKNWIQYDGKTEIIYLIKHAVSTDGIEWKKQNNFCIPSVYQDEAQNRPTVIKYNDKYIMFFSYRRATDFRNNRDAGYKLCYAVSSDKINWQRSKKDFFTINLDKNWDSEMQAYPCTLVYNNKLYLFYNGNEFGKYGFGYAETEL